MRWCELFEDDRPMPLDKPNQPPDPRAAAIAKGLADAKRRGIRLPGEPSAEWGKITPEQIIQLTHKTDTNPSTDFVDIPAGSSPEQVLALLLGKPNGLAHRRSDNERRRNVSGIGNLPATSPLQIPTPKWF
jgi:hypothetical protein